MNMTTQSKTFRSVETWRGCEEFGSGRLVRTETVYANGHVDSHVVGNTRDDGYINERSTREYGPLDLEVVTAARLRSGWTVVE